MSEDQPLPPLRDVIARHRLSADKALGQNFLLDSQLLDRIAAVPGNLNGQRVLEIGPGPGGLTRALLSAGAHVTAIERDRRCLPALAEVAEAYQGRLKVVEGDALAIDHDDLFKGGYHVVANLPYNIATPLFTRWLTPESWPPKWQTLTLMFQREVADRIVARSGSSAYGRLSILAQWRCKARLAMKVHRSAFVPPPKVMSAIVHLRPTRQPPGVNPAILEALTQAGFGQRRKMLRQSLKAIPGALDVLEQCEIDPTRRAETVSVSEFVRIAQALT